MSIFRSENTLFVLALLAFIALGFWWTVFLNRSVELERSAHRAELMHHAEIKSIKLGREKNISLGPVSGSPKLEILLSANNRAENSLAWSLEPEHPLLIVRPTSESLDAIDQRLARRKIMVIGEGTFLFFLILVCTVMLYRLVSQERKYLGRLEDFVSSFTHDLKTPLAGIKSLLQTLKADRVPQEKRLKLITLGIQQSERLQRHIENVLLSGSLKAHRYTLSLSPLEIKPILDEVLERTTSIGPNFESALTVHCGKGIEGAIVCGERQPLMMIIGNLIGNALKYGAGKPIEIACTLQESRVSIKVRDYGIGFDPQSSERLFQQFFRGTSGTTHQTEGAGLGLYIARTLARRMNGDIRAHSSGPGTGSLFELTLPLGQ